MSAICGPQEYNDSILWWINFYYLPLCLGIIFLIYSIWMFKLLRYHLYIKHYNYASKEFAPTKYMKRTAVLLPILFAFMCLFCIINISLQLIGYKQNTVIPPYDLFTEYYPNIYYVAGVFQAFCILFYVIAAVAGHLHVCNLLILYIQNSSINSFH